jgi:putative membrane protein
MKFIANWLLNALALYLVSRIIHGIHLQDFWSAVIAVAIIGLINVIIKPILLLLTLPVTLITLGLFTFIINASLFMLASKFTPGFKVDTFFAALVGSVLFSLFSTIFHRLVRS